MSQADIIILLTSFFGPQFNFDNFCQNLYFQPNSIEKMEVFQCDIEKTHTQIFQVKSGKL